MQAMIDELAKQAAESLGQVSSKETLASFWQEYLSKNGKIPALMKNLRSVVPEERPAMGKIINELKQKVQADYDAAAAKRLDINLDDCIIWVGMDVRTESGDVVGYCSDVEFKPRSGIVQAFYVTAGAASSVLVGDTQVPPTMLRGYADGAMIVSDEVKSLGYSGGAAAKAAEASVVVGDKVKKGAKVLDDKGSVAVDKGSRALGKQLGKTRGMFKAFKDEYQKASGGSSKATK